MNDEIIEALHALENLGFSAVLSGYASLTPESLELEDQTMTARYDTGVSIAVTNPNHKG